MRMDKYSGAGFVGLADLKDGPIEAAIIDVSIGKYDKPVLTVGSEDGLLDGAMVALNKSNVARLIRVFGNESSGWINRRIEMSVGVAKNNEGVAIDSVVTRGLGPRSTAATSAKGEEPNGDMDEDIPF